MLRGAGLIAIVGLVGLLAATARGTLLRHESMELAAMIEGSEETLWGMSAEGASGAGGSSDDLACPEKMKWCSEEGFVCRDMAKSDEIAAEVASNEDAGAENAGSKGAETEGAETEGADSGKADSGGAEASNSETVDGGDDVDGSSGVSGAGTEGYNTAESDESAGDNSSGAAAGDPADAQEGDNNEEDSSAGDEGETGVDAGDSGNGLAATAEDVGDTAGDFAASDTAGEAAVSEEDGEDESDGDSGGDDGASGGNDGAAGASGTSDGDADAGASAGDTAGEADEADDGEDESSTPAPEPDEPGEEAAAKEEDELAEAGSEGASGAESVTTLTSTNDNTDEGGEGSSTAGSGASGGSASGSDASSNEASGNDSSGNNAGGDGASGNGASGPGSSGDAGSTSGTASDPNHDGENKPDASGSSAQQGSDGNDPMAKCTPKGWTPCSIAGVSLSGRPLEVAHGGKKYCCPKKDTASTTPGGSGAVGNAAATAGAAAIGGAAALANGQGGAEEAVSKCTPMDSKAFMAQPLSARCKCTYNGRSAPEDMCTKFRAKGNGDWDCSWNGKVCIAATGGAAGGAPASGGDSGSGDSGSGDSGGGDGRDSSGGGSLAKCTPKGWTPCSIAGVSLSGRPLEVAHGGKKYCCPKKDAASTSIGGSSAAGNAAAPAGGSDSSGSGPMAKCMAKGFTPCSIGGLSLSGRPLEVVHGGKKYCCPKDHAGAGTGASTAAGPSGGGAGGDGDESANNAASTFKIADGMVIALQGGMTNRMCADEGRRIACNRNWVRSWERFRVKVLKDGKVALQGGRRNKWCADEGHRIACNRNWVRGWEKFTVVYHGGRMISLKGGRSRGTKFCADEGHTTKCNRAQAATGEKFKVKCLSGCNSGGPAAGGGVAPKPKPDAKITLTDGMVIGFKGGRWKKLCADEGWRIRCNRNHLKSWEKFTVKTLKGGKIALKGGKDGRWCADQGNTIRCNRNWVRGWEKFSVIYHGGNSISLKGGRGHKYCADEGRITKCNRIDANAWEKFDVQCVQGCKAKAMPTIATSASATTTIAYTSADMVKKSSIPPGKTCVKKSPVEGRPVTKITDVARLATQCHQEAARIKAPAFVIYPKGAAHSNCWTCNGVDLRTTKVKSGSSYVIMTRPAKASPLKVARGADHAKMKKCCESKNFFLPCKVRYNGFLGIRHLPDYEYAMDRRGKKTEWCCPDKKDAKQRKCFTEFKSRSSSRFHTKFRRWRLRNKDASYRYRRFRGGNRFRFTTESTQKRGSNVLLGLASGSRTVHKWLFGKGAKPMVCVDPDNEGTVIHSKAEMIKMKAEKQKAEVEEIKNAKIVNGEIKKMEGVEGCKKNCEGSHEDKPSDAEGASGETGSETDPEVNAELVNEKAQVEVEAAKTEAALEKAEHAAEETEAKEDQIAEDKEKAEEEKNSSDPEKKKAAEAALAKAQADEKKLEKEEEDASKTAKKAEEDGLKAMTKAAADGKKKAEAKDKEVSEKKAEDDKKKTAALLAAAVAPAAAAATKAATDSAAKSTKNAFDEATKEAARLPGGGKGAAGRGSYFCCSQENALGGVSTLEEADDAGFRAAALPFVQFVESTYDSAQLPDVISERKLFQQGKISVEHALNLDKATVSEDGTFHYSLTVPAVKALCGEKAEALSAKEPAGEDLPVQEAVAPAMEGKPVDKGKVGAIVAKAGGPDKASNFCTTCGKGERMHPYSADGIKAAGVALLQKDCKEGSDGVEKVDIKLQFQDDGAMKLAVKANSHEVIEHVYKSKLEELCVPVSFYHGAISLLFCSKGDDLPPMTTKSGKELKKHHKFGVGIVVGPGEIPVAGLSKQTPLIPLHPTGSYLNGLFTDGAKDIFAPCEKGPEAAVALGRTEKDTKESPDDDEGSSGESGSIEISPEVIAGGESGVSGSKTGGEPKSLASKNSAVACHECHKTCVGVLACKKCQEKVQKEFGPDACKQEKEEGGASGASGPATEGKGTTNAPELEGSHVHQVEFADINGDGPCPSSSDGGIMFDLKAKCVGSWWYFICTPLLLHTRLSFRDAATKCSYGGLTLCVCY